MESRNKDLDWSRYGWAASAGLLYGLGIRLLFTPAATWFFHFLPGWAQPAGTWVMTIGFLAVVPFTMGWIAIPRNTHDGRSHWTLWILLPWLPVLICNGCLLLGRVEGWICVVLSLPITLLFASLGGVTAGVGARNRMRRTGAATMCLALLPLLVSGLETGTAAPVAIREVKTEIRIDAPAATVWRKVERVSAIRPSELRPTWTHRIGFPLPIEATLDHEGVGGVRHATFQGGLMFVETISTWEPERRLGFRIAADTEHIPPTTLDEHVTIGGRYFDVLDGEYRLEPLPDGTTLLHLSSRERVSTDFNAYASFWSDAVMRDLQQSILEVVRNRCEREGSARLKP